MEEKKQDEKANVKKANQLLKEKMKILRESFIKKTLDYSNGG